MATILCVDDEPAALLVLRSALDRAGHRSIAVNNVEAAFNVLNRGPVDLIICDYRMPDTNGLEFLNRLVASGSDVPLVMATGHASIEHAVTAIKAGAVDYITKPVRPDHLAVVVDQALAYARLRRENDTLRREVRQLRREHPVIGESLAMQRITDLLRTVAPSQAAVLLYGEPGTGKALLARAIHELSDRAEGPFITVECAAAPESVVQRALFGQERPAGSDGSPHDAGALDRAHRGTLLLSEVAELRPEAQSEMLRVLQEQEFARPGGSTVVRVDVRVIATTRRNLAEEVRQRQFREDLYYRLSVVPVRVPPLRERPEDIPLLARHFAARVARDMGKQFDGFEPEALTRLQVYGWPGNARELTQAIERAMILSRETVLPADAFDLVRAERASPRSIAAAPWIEPDRGERVTLNSLDIGSAEVALIARALAVTNNNRTRAAELLGISVRTLRNKLNRQLTPEG